MADGGKEVENVFRKWDPTGRGVMPAAELRLVLEQVGVARPTIDSIFKAAGESLDGPVLYRNVIASVFGSKVPMVKRIAITGGPCGGKSSALSALSEALKALGIDVYLIPEVPTVLFGGGAVFPGLDGGQKLIDFETALIRLQTQHENSFYDIARSTGRPSVIFMDRGVMDIAAYLPRESWEQILAAEGMTEASILARYDAVMHLVTAAHGAEAFYKCGNVKDDSGKDVYRAETAEMARGLDDKVYACWSKHPEVCRVENLDDGFKGKLRRSVEFVTEVVGPAGGIVASFAFGKPAPGPASQGGPAGLAGPPTQASINKWASPGRSFASPSNMPIRDYKSSKKVNFDNVKLTNAKADFSRLGGMRTELDEPLFLETLKALIGESKFLQNNPRLGVIPEEKRASAIVQRTLSEFSTANGGPLQIEELTYVEGRPNLKVVYPGTSSKTISFIGSHFDVVPADAESWSRDPFTLTQEGDKLYGRGTTDCLGHVALLTTFLYELGKKKPKLENSIVVCFIAAEEGGEHGVGVDMAVKHNRLDEIKNGPVYWIDCADSQPCLGTAGALSWSIKFKGRLFHSGFPHKGINSIELAAEAMSILQERFYQDFPPVPEEDTYLFAVGSTMKPTQIECQKGSFNQICPETTVHGDIRLSPFYDVKTVMATVDGYVKDLNESMADLRTRGPYSTFVLGDDVETQAGENKAGVVEFKWNGTLDNFLLYEGVAVDLESPGHKAMVQAFREAQGSVKPFAVNGTLPLVSQMKKAGFDLQLCGFGLMAVYHGIDEYCTLTDMKRAYEVIARMTALLETGAS